MSSATFDNVVKNVKDIMLSIVNINPYNDATSEMDFKTMLIICLLYTSDAADEL